MRAFSSMLRHTVTNRINDNYQANTNNNVIVNALVTDML